MCVTHLPQVAGCGHHHFIVSKETDGEMTETHMQPLDKRSLQELARLLGGSEVTRNTSRTRKNCWRHKLFGISGHRTTKTPPDQFQSGARSIIIGILQMSHVLLGPEKESNHYAL
jgi:hypothetical protein